MDMEEQKGEARAEKKMPNSDGNYYTRYINDFIDEKFTSIFKKNNFMALLLKFIGCAIIGIGILVWSIISIIVNKLSVLLLLEIFLISCGLSLGFFAIAEIIQILHDIRFKLWIK